MRGNFRRKEGGGRERERGRGEGEGKDREENRKREIGQVNSLCIRI